MTMKKETSDLSFKSFLKKYIKSLSLGNTLSVRKLISEASTTNLRLVEPLILYIFVYQLESTYAKFRNNDALDQKMSDFIAKYSSSASLMIELENKAVDVDYQKVFNTYLSYRNKKANEKDLKLKIVTKALELIEVKKISKYRLSKELGINPGNLNSYLNHRMSEALNMQKCNSLLNYLISH